MIRRKNNHHFRKMILVEVLLWIYFSAICVGSIKKLGILLLTIYFWLVAIISVVITSIICIIIYPFVNKKIFCNIFHMTIGIIVMTLMRPFWSLKIKGDFPKQQCVMVANHESFIDSLLMAQIPIYKKFIMAGKYARIPLFGQLCIASGAVPFDKNGPGGTVDICKRAMSDGSSFVIYPEGKRSDVGLLEFKTGAFRLAKETGVPIIPVTLKGTSKALGIGGWCYPSNLEIIIGSPIYIQNIDEGIQQARNTIRRNLLFNSSIK